MILSLFAWLLSASAFAHGGGEASIEVGPRQGVVEVTEQKAFKLSPEAYQTLGIQTQKISGPSVSLPRDAVVHSLKQSQIFRLRNGFIQPIEVHEFSKSESTITLQSKELKSPDEVVTHGTGFLRMIAVQLGEAEEGHDEHEEEHHD